MKRFRFNQQEIVFAVFALLFLVFSIFLRGFLTPENMLTLLQNVSPGSGADGHRAIAGAAPSG